MRRIIICGVLLLGLGTLASCGSSSNPAFTGDWLFVLTPAASLSSIQVSASLTQNGSNITGSATLSQSGTACGMTATVSGTAKGNTLSLQLLQDESPIDLTGTANQAFTSISGTYSAAAGPCFSAASDGDLSATLQ